MLHHNNPYIPSLIASFFLLLTITNVTAQGNYFKYDSICHGELAFPIFSSPLKPAVAEKINQYLQLSELEVLAGHEQKDIFEKASVNNGSIYGGKVNIEFSLLANNNRELAIMFDETSCGLTCAYWNIYYHFNAGNGDRILLRDLFDSGGYEKFRNLVLEKREMELQRECQGWTEEAKEELLEDLRLINQEDIDNFFITNDSIVDDSWDSDPRHKKFPAPEISPGFGLNEFQTYLSDLGKLIFGLKTGDVAKFRSKELPQLYAGTIDDKDSILLIIRKLDEKTADGIYAYTRFGLGIDLRGTIENDSLHLIVETPKFEDNGYIEVLFNWHTIQGTYMDKERSKALKLEAHLK